MDIIITVFEQGFILGILALGSYISYKILNFPDLSVEGSFPLGAVVTAILILKGVNPFICCLLAFLAGAMAGALTGIIHVKLKITDLLSGIIVLTALYSVNLIIAGRANLPIFSEQNIFDVGFKNKLLTSFLFFLCSKIILDLYLKTKSGLLLRSAGDNAQYVTSLGKDVGLVKIFGLLLSNAFVALSGSIWCQYQRFFDVSMGKSMIIIGISSVIIGSNVLKHVKFVKGTTMAGVGCIIYNTCVAVAIAIGFSSEYMNLIISTLFLAALIINRGVKKNVKG